MKTGMIYGKIWELILILALVGMMFILQLDHKNNMENRRKSRMKKQESRRMKKIKQILQNQKSILEICLLS